MADGTPRGRPSSQDTGTSEGRDQLAQALSELARELHRASDPEAALELIVRGAVRLIPGVDEGSISLVRGRRQVTSEAPSADLPKQVDEIQEQEGQGPCLDACYEHETVRVVDLATETRWPRFTPRALAAGAAGMLSFQLFVDGDDLGALNLYSREPDRFDDRSEHVGLLFASHAAVAYSALRQQAGITAAVASRQVIGQAQGVLMERHKLTADQAFSLLVRASQRDNVKLRDVAATLVHDGQLPHPTP